MAANRDLMALALEPAYGPDNSLADWEAAHWVSLGFEPCGPGDKASWYASEGATGTYYGDLEADYWANVYGSSLLLQEDGFYILQEDGSYILI